MAQNRNIREKIDALRQEKVVFDRIYAKLEKNELEEKMQNMDDIIEKAKAAYTEREGAK